MYTYTNTHKQRSKTHSVYYCLFTARNPPPFCIGTGVPLLNVCVRVYDIRVQRQSVRACANLELQFAGRPLIVVSFDCVRISSSGIGVEKPPSVGLVRGPDPVHMFLKSNFRSSDYILTRKNSGVIKLPVTLFASINAVSSNVTSGQDLTNIIHYDKGLNQVQVYEDLQ